MYVGAERIRYSLIKALEFRNSKTFGESFIIGKIIKKMDFLKRNLVDVRSYSGIGNG